MCRMYWPVESRSHFGAAAHRAFDTGHNLHAVCGCRSSFCRGTTTYPGRATSCVEHLWSLEVTSASCNGSCSPGESFHIGFSNQLDTDSLRDGMVSIRPDLPNGEMHISPGGIWLTGDTAPRTVYTLRIAPGLTDVYGQVLDRVKAFQIRVVRPVVRSVARSDADRTQALHLPNFVEVLHPDDGGKYSIFPAILTNWKLSCTRLRLQIGIPSTYLNQVCGGQLGVQQDLTVGDDSCPLKQVIQPTHLSKTESQHWRQPFRLTIA